MLLESFVGAVLNLRCSSQRLNIPPEDMRLNQHLITNDVVRYMAEYEVGDRPPNARLPYPNEKTRLAAGYRRPRRNRPPRAIVGGLVFCVGSRRRVSGLGFPLVGAPHSIRRRQPVQVRPHHLLRLHRQLPDARLLRPARDLRGRVQEAPRRDPRALHARCRARCPRVRAGRQTVAGV